MKSFYLDGRWAETKTSEPVHNPWSGEKFAEVCMASPVDGESAVADKPVTFAEAEVDRARLTFQFAAALADDRHGLNMEASKPGAGHFGMVRRFPIGVILGITPFNFPLNLLAHKVAPCLATGNAMVHKPCPRSLVIKRSWRSLFTTASRVTRC